MEDPASGERKAGFFIGCGSEIGSEISTEILRSTEGWKTWSKSVFRVSRFGWGITQRHALSCLFISMHSGHNFWIKANFVKIHWNSNLSLFLRKRLQLNRDDR